MRHPRGRAERRFNGDVWRERQRFIMRNTWRINQDWTSNNMWWARKKMQCHSDCCNAHKKSSKEIRKRRRALDTAVKEGLCD